MLLVTPLDSFIALLSDLSHNCISINVSKAFFHQFEFSRLYAQLKSLRVIDMRGWGFVSFYFLSSACFPSDVADFSDLPNVQKSSASPTGPAPVVKVS